MLAGVSVDYYARLERGNLAGASASVLEALARALQLDEAERQHLFDLARHPIGAVAPTPRRKPAGEPRPALQSILAGMTAIPAYLRTSGMEIVAANELCHTLYGGVLDDDRLPLNLARFGVPGSPLSRLLPGLGPRGRRSRRGAPGPGRP